MNSSWFADAKYGMFIHWGLYALPGRGEWAMHRDGVPAEEYNMLAEKWNPAAGSPDSWCRAAADAGMKYAVFTTRHHDGFSLFRTKADSFHSGNTPCGLDHTEEFTEACRRHGLKIGLYYSLVDWRLTEKPEEMREKVRIQLRELMTNYGKIDLLWYDGTWAPEGKTPAEFWDSTNLNAEIRRMQPGILINERSGVPEDFSSLEGRNIIRRPTGAKLWELCMTLGDDDFSYWGYCRHSAFRRTPEQALMLLLHTLEQGGNLLLNASPDGDGRIPDWQDHIFSETGKWVRANAEAVYGTRSTEIARRIPNDLQGNSCGFFTSAGNGIYYFYCYAWPGTEMRIPFLRADVRGITILRTGTKLEFHRDARNVLHISGMPELPSDPLCTVLKFEMTENT